MPSLALACRLSAAPGALKPLYKRLESAAISAARRNNAALWYVPDLALGSGNPNLLSFPEDFDNAAWIKPAAITVVPNSDTAPDGSQSADKLVANNGVTSASVYRSTGITSGPAAVSFYAKAGGWRYLRATFGASFSPQQTAYLDLVSGTSSNPAWTMVADSNGYWRCSVASTWASAADAFFYFAPTNSNSSYSTGDGVNGVFVWGFKVEQASAATAYTPQSVLRQYGAFFDAAGTTAPWLGSTIGLLLDRQYGAANLGPELVSDPGFDNASKWTVGYTAPGSATISGSQAVIASPAGESANIETKPSEIAVVSGKYYAVTLDISSYSGSASVYSGATVIAIPSGAGKKTVIVSAANTAIGVKRSSPGVACSLILDGISVKEVVGYQASQATTANKPLLTRVQRADGKWTPALQFNGSTQTLTVTPPAITTQATLLWAGKIDQLSNYRCLLGQGAGGIRLFCDSAGVVSMTRNGGSGLSSAAGAIVAGSMVVISGRVTVGGACNLRINGVQVASGSPSGFSTSLIGTTMALMSQDGAANYAPGTVVDWSVGATSLSDADLIALEKQAAYLAGVTYQG